MGLEKIHLNGREKGDSYDESGYDDAPRMTDGAPAGYHGQRPNTI